MSLRIKAIADFGTFAFRQTALQPILEEAARVCAISLKVPYSKICMFRPEHNDLLVVAGYGWHAGVVGHAISVADSTSPQGRAFSTGEPQLCQNVDLTNTFSLPAFYSEHKIHSTVDVIVATKTGLPFGVLETDSTTNNAFKPEDIDFLTGFANILAEAVATVERSEELKQTILQMQQLVEEKEILSQELKHRVRNNLHLVYGLLANETRRDHDKESINAFRSIARRVMGLAQVFDHLLGVGMKPAINFGGYLEALCCHLPELYDTSTIQLTCIIEYEQHIKLDDATALGIIITELINNAYLHAFPNAGEGNIMVTFKLINNFPILTISDDGIGFTEVPNKRHGMNLVRRLLKQVNSTMEHTSFHGTEWIITLPEIATI